MAAVTGAVIGGAALAYSVGKSIKDAKEKKAIEKEINNTKAPNLVNSGNGLQVSTLGADLEKEQQAQLASNQVQTAQEAGTRGVIGSVGKIAAGNQAVNAKIAANLDQQQKEIDFYKAQDESNIRALNEQRYKDKIAALSSQYNAANQSQQQAIGNAFSASQAAVSGFGANRAMQNNNNSTGNSQFSSSQYNLPSGINYKFNPNYNLK